MENKKTYIDGVDVSECEFYFDEKCRCMDASIMQDFHSCPQCNSNPNCNYKQLKRKEQECKKLKETITSTTCLYQTRTKTNLLCSLR